jgi:hypothetical protein
MKLIDANECRWDGWWAEALQKANNGELSPLAYEAVAVMTAPSERSFPTAVMSERELDEFKLWCQQNFEIQWDDEDEGEPIEVSDCPLKLDMVYRDSSWGYTWYVDSRSQFWLLDTDGDVYHLISGEPPCRSYWMPQHFEDFRALSPSKRSIKIQDIVKTIKASLKCLQSR